MDERDLPGNCGNGSVKRSRNAGEFSHKKEELPCRSCAAALRKRKRLQIGVLIGGRFRTAVQAIGITDPIGSIVHQDAAPLVGPLVFVYMLIGDPQNIQAQARGAGASGAGGDMQHQIAVGIVIMGCVGGIDHCAIVHHGAQSIGNAVQLIFPAHQGQRDDDLQRFLIACSNTSCGESADESCVHFEVVSSALL